MTPLKQIVDRLDQWWAEVSPRRRLDRGPANLFMLAGLMLPSLSIILRGPTPNSVLRDMPDALQIAMCFCIFVGCGIKLHGALSGMRWYFPKANLQTCYRWGYTGAPMATMGALVYGWFILSGTDNFLSALGGISTPLFGCGISVQAVMYWLESRRIERNERILIRQAKSEIRRESDSDS